MLQTANFTVGKQVMHAILYEPPRGKTNNVVSEQV